MFLTPFRIGPISTDMQVYQKEVVRLYIEQKVLQKEKLLEKITPNKP